MNELARASSDLRVPDRFAIAAAIQSTPGEESFLFGLRQNSCAEYKRAWSLPSCSVTEAEYSDLIRTEKPAPSLLRKLCQKSFGADVPLQLSLVKNGVRYRPRYCLHMAVLAGTWPRRLPTNPRKYAEFQTMSVEHCLTLLQGTSSLPGRVGTCVSMLIDHLAEKDRVDSAIQYLEVPPELWDSRRKIESFSADELWKLAAKNYALLREERSGSDGEFIRARTIDRFLANALKIHLGAGDSLLDVGCGGGDLVAAAARRGIDALGVDLSPDPLRRHRSIAGRLIQSSIENIPTKITRRRFDLVVLNLVCQWVEDLNKLAEIVAAVTSRGGRVLVSLVPPEFAKNGGWTKQNGEYCWLITEPLRRSRVLVMVNRAVGPLWYYPRTTPDYLTAFGSAGLSCVQGDYIFIDSMLSAPERTAVFELRRDLIRHERLPVFLVLQFKKTSVNNREHG